MSRANSLEFEKKHHLRDVGPMISSEKKRPWPEINVDRAPLLDRAALLKTIKWF
jgi:hypothetical protein